MKKNWTLMIGIFIIAAGFYSFSGVSSLNASKTNGIDSIKKVCISTNYGDIKVKLYNETPKHRDNFIKLAKEAYFDGTLFHRVIKDFMIQGGDPDSKNADSTAILGNGGPKYTIPAEILLDTVTSKSTSGVMKKEINVKRFHKKGALAAARDENPAKASSGSQFYIVEGRVFPDSVLSKLETNINAGKFNQHITDYLLRPENASLKDEVIKDQKAKNMHKLDSIVKIVSAIVVKQFGNEPQFAFTKDQRKVYETIGGTPYLDGNYTVFGEVYEGLDVVDKIAAVKTGANDRPKKDVKIISVKVIE